MFQELRVDLRRAPKRGNLFRKNTGMRWSLWRIRLVVVGRRPGFVGVFSGVAPGRFAVTLNAVLSAEPPQPATPVVLLLRTVLEHAQTFNYLATGRNGG